MVGERGCDVLTRRAPPKPTKDTPERYQTTATYEYSTARHADAAKNEVHVVVIENVMSVVEIKLKADN